MLLQISKMIFLIFISVFIIVIFAGVSFSQEIFIDAQVIAIEELNPSIKAKFLPIRLTFFNKTNETIMFEPYKPKGKELFDSPDGFKMLSKKYLISAYIDQLKVTYIEPAKKVTYQFYIPFPLAAVILPQSYSEVLLQIQAPSTSGKFNIKFDPVASKDVPINNSINIESKYKIICIDQIKPFSIEEVEITD